MKISNPNLGKSPNSVSSTSSQKIDGKAKKSEFGLDSKNDIGGGPSGAARVDVSDRAQQMQKAKEIAGSPDSIDEAKVARLQKLIDEGNYKVDAEGLADKLIDTHMQFPE